MLGSTRWTRPSSGWCVADVLDAILKAHERNESIESAIAAVITWDTLSADARLIRRSSRSGKVDVLSELGREHYIFRAIGPRFLTAISFQGSASDKPLLSALGIVSPKIRFGPRASAVAGPTAGAAQAVATAHSAPVR